MDCCKEEEPLSDHWPIKCVFRFVSYEVALDVVPRTARVNPRTLVDFTESFRQMVGGVVVLSAGEFSRLAAEVVRRTMVVRRGGRRRQVYWWNDNIAAARQQNVRVRRIFLAGSRREDEDEVYHAAEELRQARR